MRGARHAADRRRRSADGPGSRPGRRTRGRPGRWLTWVAVGLAGVLVAAGGAAVVAVWRLQGNIRAVDVSGGLGNDRPTSAAEAGERGPLNVLVLGSDSREGANSFIGGKVDEGRSDTTLLLHLSADRRRALAVSIPRDSVVEMPACTDREGAQSTPGLKQFNDAYTVGGAACTLRTVEQLTGVRVDHYVVVDFAGFKGMVDALGTVPICLPHAVDDPRHNIHLQAGRSRVDGAQALAYVRARYTLGDGGDLGRIERQQTFLASVLQEATGAGTLTNPPKLYAFLDAATRSVTMDPQLASLPRLAGLAKQVSDIGLGNVQFVTVPTEPYEVDPNRLQWSPAAGRLWRAIRQDLPVSFAAPGASPSPSPAASEPPSPSGSDVVEPGQVRLRVLNASGRPGAAGEAAAELREAGWNVVGVGDAEASGATATRIRYGPGELAERRALALAAVLPGAELELDPAVGSILRVEVGSDWAGVRDATPGASGGSDDEQVVVPGVQSRTAAADICGE